MEHNPQNAAKNNSRLQESIKLSSPYFSDSDRFQRKKDDYLSYANFTGKGLKSFARFSDMVHSGEGVRFDLSKPSDSLVFELIDTPVVQRLRNIKQLSHTNQVFKDGEHSRFVHSLGCAVLALKALDSLKRNCPSKIEEIERFAPAVAAAALLHDIGHIEPGSHVAQSVWFPNMPDMHEQVTARIISEDRVLKFILENAEVFKDVLAVVQSDTNLPAWTWMLVSGNGWNVDRGNWVYLDSVNCGVYNGLYDIGPLIDCLTIADDSSLAIKPAGVGAIENFFTRRQEMYRTVYFHEVARVLDQMDIMIGRRLRELRSSGASFYSDHVLDKVLDADSAQDLEIPVILEMDNSWWHYHLKQWTKDSDPILADLARRLVCREPFKRIASLSAVEQTQYHSALSKIGLDSEYYFMRVPEVPPMASKEFCAKTIKVKLNDGELVALEKFSSDLKALKNVSTPTRNAFMAVPLEVFSEFKEH